jgi:hypothetical protein
MRLSWLHCKRSALGILTEQTKKRERECAGKNYLILTYSPVFDNPIFR